MARSDRAVAGCGCCSTGGYERGFEGLGFVVCFWSWEKSLFYDEDADSFSGVRSFFAYYSACFSPCVRQKTNRRLSSQACFPLYGLERPLSLCRSSCSVETCVSTLTRIQCSSADLDFSSFFQSVCIIGYTLFPLVIAALLSAFRLPTIARIPVYIVLVAWSLAAGVSILGGSGVVRNRVGLAVYPLLVFYVSIGCLCFIS